MVRRHTRGDERNSIDVFEEISKWIVTIEIQKGQVIVELLMIHKQLVCVMLA